MPLGSAKWFGHRHGSLSSLTRFVWIVCTWSHVQALQTGQFSLTIKLGPETATQPDMIPPTEPLVNMTIVYPSDGINSDLPWIMLMSGANCYSQDYSLLEQQLAGRGYLVAIVDELHPITPEYSYALAPNREPQCPNNSWSTPTASIFNDVYTFLSSNLRKTSTSTFPTLPIAAIAQIESVNLEAVVMLGHSLGGSVAVDILTGVCDDPEAAECGNYTPILDSSSRDIIKGLILWEGYEAINDSILVVPDGTFLTYLSSPNLANLTDIAYEYTEGQCVDYIQLNQGNHYAITDWNPATAPHQRSPCGLDNGASTSFTSESEQDERLLFISQLIDSTIRAQLLNDTTAASFLTDQVPDSPFVEVAHLASECYESD